MIKIRKIWDIIPIPIIITDLLPKKFGGGTLICIVLIRPKHKDNEGLILLGARFQVVHSFWVPDFKLSIAFGRKVPSCP